jgi:hypothetical protein
MSRPYKCVIDVVWGTGCLVFASLCTRGLHSIFSCSSSLGFRLLASLTRKSSWWIGSIIHIRSEGQKQIGSIWSGGQKVVRRRQLSVLSFTFHHNNSTSCCSTHHRTLCGSKSPQFHPCYLENTLARISLQAIMCFKCLHVGIFM